MGILKNGPNGEVTGRLGNLVHYNLNGQNIVRRIGKSSKPPTLPQLSARMANKISGKILKSLKQFIQAGLELEAIGTNKNAFNIAVEINRNKMIKGVYPDLEIDYPKLELSRGILKPGSDLQASLTDEAIVFTWAADPKMEWKEASDLVMMLAYFPEQDRTLCKIGGNARSTGTDQLLLPPSLKNKYAELYIAFAAADRKQVSDSTYLGSLNLING
ncbi:MAG: hypothetical protein EOO92_06270 [Pedobacter sp.]|nr:MAG: hypothetical protein EOO92_06270 [Pedobacter sp.]